MSRLWGVSTACFTAKLTPGSPVVRLWLARCSDSRSSGLASGRLLQSATASLKRCSCCHSQLVMRPPATANASASTLTVLAGAG